MSTREFCKARRDFQRALQEDRLRRVQAVGSNIECFMEAGRFKEAWYHFAGWCHQSQGKQDLPTREDLDQELVDRSELSRFQPPARLKVPILIQPTAILTEEEIELVVQELKCGIAGGPSGMRAENRKGWLKEANHEKDPEGRRWELVVQLI